MRIHISAGWVSIENGKVTRSMTLEQYRKHCADGTFAGAVPLHLHDAISKATPTTSLTEGTNIIAPVALSPTVAVASLTQRIVDTATA